jgi:hypothetical protein
VKPRYPKKLTPEFLLVDLVNNVGKLAEDRAALLANAREKVREMQPRRLRTAVKRFSKVSTRKFFEEVFGNAY